MTAVADTAEGSGELDFNTWLIDNKLSSLLKNKKFLETIKEQEPTVKDILGLNEQELVDFAQECGLRILEKKKFVNAVKKLQDNKVKPDKAQKPTRIKIIMTEAEENAMENVRKEQNKLAKYIKSIPECIKNTKNNAKTSANTINEEFNIMIDILNKRKLDLETQLKDIEKRKLKIYNDNLGKAMAMNKELNDIEIEWDALLENTRIARKERKNQIISQSKHILIKSNNVFKNEMIRSVNDTFHTKFSSTQNYKYIGNIGTVDGNDAVPDVSVTNISGNVADIKIELKSDDEISLYGLQCKRTKDESNNENVFMDEDQEEKDNLCAYLEFKESEYCIKNLEFECNYAIRVKAKIAHNLWTKYSNIKCFETKNKFIDSIILTDPKDVTIFANLLCPKLKSILNKQMISLRLLYRNSRDGNSGQSFHSKCNGYANTITLVHSNFNHVFGGFTTYKWGSASSSRTDNNAFLFLVKSAFNDKPKIYKHKSDGTEAVCDYNGYGPTFGGGHDLVVQGGGGPYCNSNYTFEGSGNALCGGNSRDQQDTVHSFTLKEYEVYCVE